LKFLVDFGGVLCSAAAFQVFCQVVFSFGSEVSKHPNRLLVWSNPWERRKIGRMNLHGIVGSWQHDFGDVGVALVDGADDCLVIEPNCFRFKTKDVCSDFVGGVRLHGLPEPVKAIL